MKRKKKIFTLFFITCIVLTLKFTIFASYDFVGLDDTVDVSPNDDEIVFSYYTKGVASIYSSKINGKDAIKLTSDNKKDSHLYPTYSPDGSKIMFISTPKNQTSQNSSIWIMDKYGKNKKELLQTNGFINKAIFSPDQKRIYFSKSGVYKNYSPIASKRHHDFDIHSMNIDGNDLRQLTFDKSYNLENLGITSDGGALIFSKFDEKDNENKATENIYLYHLDGSKKIDIIEPSNFKSGDFYDPALSPDDKSMAFSTVADPNGTFYYDLFTINLATKECKQITALKSHVSRPVYLHKSNKILFLQDVNWPNHPFKYEIRIIDINSNNTDISTYNIEKINMDINSK